MNKRWFYVALTGVMCSCSHAVYTNLWQPKPVAVDGNDSEWSIPLRFYDNPSKLQYTVSNDNTNLYLCIRATDEQTQAKIARAGMQIWIDTTGKNKHQVGIAYPVINKEKYTDQKSSDNHSFKKKIFDDLNEMQLTGFKSPVIGGVTSVLDNSAVNLKMSMDKNSILIYEIAIPFKSFYKTTLSPADSNKVMGLTIAVNGLSVAKTSGRSSGMGGGGGRGGMRGGGGGGGMRGGGGRSMGGGSGMNDRSGMFETNTIKTKMKLSAH